jgi:LAS superfamily LD-carboxypeptidase LdcB
MAENLNNMIKDANAAGVPLTCGSNFRTMQGQIDAAKGNGCYRSGDYVRGNCRIPTAKPGNSKHQSGFAIDFGCNGKTICFSNSSAWCAANGATKRPKEYPCFVWLQNNASKYKFYNYKDEAWHWSVDGT